MSAAEAIDRLSRFHAAVGCALPCGWDVYRDTAPALTGVDVGWLDTFRRLGYWTMKPGETFMWVGPEAMV